MLRVVELTKRYAVNRGKASETVLMGVNFTAEPGEIVGITGKSGAGKSTIARIICGLIMPDSGEVYYNNELLINAKQAFPKAREIQLIPQQPMSALDPRQRIGDAIAEPMLYHKIAKSKREARDKAVELLRQVWLEPEIASRYPAQISGGQAQRAVIARALGLSPRLLIADESTSMLDIPAQAQVVSLLRNLVTDEGITILLISHDKPLIQALSNKVYDLSNSVMTLRQ